MRSLLSMVFYAASVVLGVFGIICLAGFSSDIRARFGTPGIVVSWVFVVFGVPLFKLGRSVAKKRLDPHSNDPSVRMAYAQTLAKSGQYEEALRHFVWCFDHGGKFGPSFYGVRLSFLLGYIRELGKSHPPAIQALEERRDSLEHFLLTGTAEREEFHDYSALNHTLGDDRRTLGIFDRLDPKVVALKQFRSHYVFDLLMADRRYADALTLTGSVTDEVEKAVHSFQFTKAMVDGRVGLPPTPGVSAFSANKILADNGKKLVSMGSDRVLETVGELYEALLGTRRDDEAQRLVDQMLDLDSSVRTFAALIRHAIRAERPEVATGISMRGKHSLPTEQHPEIEQAIGSAPPGR